jgi:hypothetical protein
VPASTRQTRPTRKPSRGGVSAQTRLGDLVHPWCTLIRALSRSHLGSDRATSRRNALPRSSLTAARPAAEPLAHQARTAWRRQLVVKPQPRDFRPVAEAGARTPAAASGAGYVEAASPSSSRTPDLADGGARSRRLGHPTLTPPRTGGRTSNLAGTARTSRVLGREVALPVSTAPRPIGTVVCSHSIPGGRASGGAYR